jgi:hypothetical protein
MVVVEDGVNQKSIWIQMTLTKPITVADLLTSNNQSSFNFRLPLTKLRTSKTIFSHAKPCMGQLLFKKIRLLLITHLQKVVLKDLSSILKQRKK